ncbi:MAG: hypothetical protein HYT21_00935 [Candidatus Nealsonbacteria bacterium]|nr:hypothetical protein [Candidatus Nealsonbacteria bacterium]
MASAFQKQRDFLQRSARLGKIAHAYLFYGNESCGKEKLALEFIKLINCQTKNETACGSCRSCLDIEKNVSPDLFLIEPEEDEIKIAKIRELHSKLALRAYSAPYKAAVINRAHTLNAEAQSAFLKLLEEPKGQTLFVLLTEYPERLLPTILSRVERLRFYSGPTESANKDALGKIAADLSQLAKNDLSRRFAYAQKLAEKQEELPRILTLWMAYFREQLLKSVAGEKGEYSTAKLFKILNSLQTTALLLSTTNANPRLALEILMLEL